MMSEHRRDILDDLKAVEVISEEKSSLESNHFENLFLEQTVLESSNEWILL